jgi:hypothetical protein
MEMDFQHRMNLINNRVYLVENLIIDHMFIEILISKKILMRDHGERVLAAVTSGDMAAELLRIIPRRGPTAMRAFLKTLIITGQEDIANKLDREIFQSICTKLLPARRRSQFRK